MIAASTARICLYSSRKNQEFLKKLAKKAGVSQIKVMNSFLTQLRIGKMEVQLGVSSRPIKLTKNTK